MIDIERIRSDCPACQQLIHFNNAGCSLSPTPVNEAILAHLKLEQQLGGYEAAELASNSIDNFYGAFGKLLNCSPGEIAYVENATRAWDMALHSIRFASGDQILTGEMEYASNYLELLHLARQKNVEIKLVPTDASGCIDLDQLENTISARTRLIALTHIASQRGDIQPAVEVGQIARTNKVVFLLDACQSAGQLPLDVSELGCDMLCGTGRKYLRGPRGTGFLYINKDRLEELEPVFIDLHSAEWTDAGNYSLRADARRFENWEQFIAGKIGLGVAVNYALEIELPFIRSRIEELVTHFRNRASAVQGIRILEQSSAPSGIITFIKQGASANVLQKKFRSNKMNISVSKQANAQLDLGRNKLGDINRVSLHYYNTAQEIDQFIELLGTL